MLTSSSAATHSSSSGRRVGWVAGALGVALLLLLALPAPEHAQVLETIGAIVITKLIATAVGTAVAAAVEEAVVMDVFNQRNKCYESYVAWPGTLCREGYVEVHRSGPHLQCCPTQPTDCYVLNDCFADGPCAEGYTLVESGGCHDVCCPADRQHSPCFESTKCFYECPPEYKQVEAGSFADMPIPEAATCSDTCCPVRRCFASKLCNRKELSFLPTEVADKAQAILGEPFGSENNCPAGFVPIPLDISKLPPEQQAAFKAVDPFGCLDICCDEALFEEPIDATASSATPQQGAQIFAASGVKEAASPDILTEGESEGKSATASVVSGYAAQASSMATSSAVAGAVTAGVSAVAAAI